MKITLNPDDLTFGDMEDFEEFTDTPLMAAFGKIGPDGDMSGLTAKQLTGLIWICGRASHPEFTVDDARKVKVSEIEVEDDEVPADPTPAAE